MEANEALSIYQRMMRIRALDDAIGRGLRSGQFQFSFHPPTGQEAIPASLCEYLELTDHMVTTYRGMHDCVAKGVPLDALVAEMFGRRTGTSKGKGGIMHICHPASGLMCTTGIVGGGLPIAVGLALAAQMNETGAVTVVSFGDGATSIGAWHEAMNLAALWTLPVVLVCQNNGYGEHTSVEDYTRTADFCDRARAYGMATACVDGNDVPEMSAAARDAIARARRGDGPTFLDCKTFRLGPHAFGAPMNYVDRERLARAKVEEPVGRHRRYLVDHGIGDDKSLAVIEAEAVAEVAAAIRFAQDSPPPELDELLADVFAVRDGAPA